jgi:chaperonin cofactor prefoldin
MTREEELENMIATLELENKFMRERNERLQQELDQSKQMINRALAYVEGIKNGKY